MNKLDPYHLQVVSFYLQTKDDYLNLIRINKKYRMILDRFRINPIKITKETKNLFQFINTQQLFGKKSVTPIYFKQNKKNNKEKIEEVIDEIEDEEEIILEKENIKRIQYNYPIGYSLYKKMIKKSKEEKEEKETIIKKVKYTKLNVMTMGNTIPNGVNVLSIFLFNQLALQIENIVIPPTITEMQTGCFHGCFLREIIIPNSVIKVGSYCFENCYSLSKVVLSTNVIELKSNTFSNCRSLEEIILPPYLTKIGEGCFRKCSNLTKIDLSQVKEIGKGCFEKCLNLKEIILNEEMKIIESEMFKKCKSLTKINIPKKLERISFECFEECSSLQSITISKSVTYISNGCFKNCKELKEMIIENEECQKGNGFIEECISLTKLQIPSKGGKVGLYFPNKNEIKKLIIKQNKTNNGINGFKSVELRNYDNYIYNKKEFKNVTSLYIPSTITEIYHYPLYKYQNIEEVIIPENINKIGNNAFDEMTNLTKIEFADGRTRIQEPISYEGYKKLQVNGIRCENVIINETFKAQKDELPTDCNLIMDLDYNDKIGLKEIPRNVTEIKSFGFLDEMLTSLTIPSTVRVISGNKRLNYLEQLKEITIYKHQAITTPHILDELTTLTKVEVIGGDLNDIVVSYEYHLAMKEKGMILENVEYIFGDYNKYGKELPNVVKSIETYSPGMYLLEEIKTKRIEIRKVNDDVNEIQIPSYQQILYQGMFNFCGFGLISIPSTVSEIQKDCFIQCPYLTSIEYMGEINGDTINECYNLRTIPKLKTLKKSNFIKCRNLTRVELNDSIESIPPSCFHNCHSLKEINIPTNCTSIEPFSFNYCVSLTLIHIPQSVKKIDERAFYGCKGLKRIEIKNKEIEIGYDVFGKCSSLKEIIIGNEKIRTYPYEVNYSQMKEYEKIGISCTNLVIRKEDVLEYSVRIINDSRVHRIHDDCFKDNKGIEGEFVIPTHITELGMYLFSHCQFLRKVVIPPTIKRIPYCCFEHCSSLEEVILPNGIEMKEHCFHRCNKLSETTKEKIPKEYIK